MILYNVIYSGVLINNIYNILNKGNFNLTQKQQTVL